MRIRLRWFLWPALAIAALTAAVTSSRSAASTLGLQNAETVWAGIYSRPQAVRGQVFFVSECSDCHAISNFVGEDYMARWRGNTIGDLFLYIRDAMPADAHEPIGSDGVYIDIVAYLLRSNDFPAGENELGTNIDHLRSIRIEPAR